MAKTGLSKRKGLTKNAGLPDICIAPSKGLILYIPNRSQSFFGTGWQSPPVSLRLHSLKEEPNGALSKIRYPWLTPCDNDSSPKAVSPEEMASIQRKVLLLDSLPRLSSDFPSPQCFLKFVSRLGSLHDSRMSESQLPL